MAGKLYTKQTWVDEVLAGIAAYLLKDDAGDIVYEEASIELATGVITPGTAVTAATMQNIEDGIDDIDDLLVSLQSKFALDPATEITVSGGTLTLTQSVHKVQPESGTADDIDNLAGLSAGQFGVLFPSDNGTDTLTLKHGTGNISCIGGSDVALSEGAVIVYFDGTTYFVIGTSAGGGGISNVIELIADSELTGGDAASFDFTSIPATYKHLMLRFSLRSDVSSTGDYLLVRFNNDSGNNYYAIYYRIYEPDLLSAEENLASSSMSLTALIGNTGESNWFDQGEIIINNYASTHIAKAAYVSMGSMRTKTSGNISIRNGSGIWDSTSAINRITIFPRTGSNWKQYSRCSLYGIN